MSRSSLTPKIRQDETYFWCYEMIMATQDDWKRITLRIPSELHERIVEASRLSSVNAEIITRLERSFFTEDHWKSIMDLPKDVLTRFAILEIQRNIEVLDHIQRSLSPIEDPPSGARRENADQQQAIEGRHLFPELSQRNFHPQTPPHGDENSFERTAAAEEELQKVAAATEKPIADTRERERKKFVARFEKQGAANSEVAPSAQKQSKRKK
jgi:hypothetical protein